MKASSLFILLFLSIHVIGQNTEESNRLEIITDSLPTVLFTAAYAEEVINEAKTIHKKGTERLAIIEESVLGIEDKLLAAEERVQIALDLGDINENEYECRMEQIKKSRNLLNTVKPIIEIERKKLEQLEDLLNQ
ncbi:MAG: hypothetical protein ACPG21_00675 [Crocinitomicaceae bacterium]